MHSPSWFVPNAACICCTCVLTISCIAVHCRYMTPLLVSLAVQLEPVLGPALGWAAGVAAAPGLFTWVGGSVVLLATLGATLATARRQQQEEAEEAERRLLKNKSMRLVSDAGDGNSTRGSSYAALAAAEDAAGSSAERQLESTAVDVAGGGQGAFGHSGGVSRGSMGPEAGDMDVIVSERAQLLPSGSHLSHHVKQGRSDHTEIELPDIHEHK